MKKGKKVKENKTSSNYNLQMSINFKEVSVI